MSPYTTLTIRRQAAIAKLNLIDAEAAVTAWDDASNEEMGDVLGRFLKESSLFNFIVVDDDHVPFPQPCDSRTSEQQLEQIRQNESTLEALVAGEQSGTTVADLIEALQLMNQSARISAVIGGSVKGTWNGVIEPNDSTGYSGVVELVFSDD